MFILISGFFSGVSGTAGHELVHEKSAFNKFVGNWTYIIGMYTHFWDEHVNGHHNYIATDGDPVCHKKGVSIYAGIVNAYIWTHVTSW